MRRLNSEGIRREDLRWALTDAATVKSFRSIQSCMLCRRIGVNEAALCDICWTLLDDEEFSLAQQWLTGERP